MTTAVQGQRPARFQVDRRLLMPLAIILALVIAYALMVAGSCSTTGVGECDKFSQGQDQFINALTIGGIYALIALGYTLVYGIIELINFAHGEVFMCGSFVAWFTLTRLGFSGPISGNLPLLAAVVAITFLVAMLVMGVVGVVIERLAYRPLRNAPRLAPLITAIGVSFILQNLVFVGISNSIVTVPQVIPNPVLTIGPVEIRAINLFVILLTLSLMVALHLFISRTTLGRAMRSTAIDRDAAQIMGVDINSTIALTFFIGSALAGAAGVVQGLYFGVTVFNIGFQAGLKAFTAAVLGGIGNTTGAALGGFVIGFIEVLSSVFGYGRWSEAAVFGTLVLVLVFRPTGILGQQLADRA
jgi:branched-chain amino acid transport system permease protein